MATNEEELSDLLRLAKDGDVDAQMCLGDYYVDDNLGNLGVQPDLSKAIHFYTLAALQGLTEAQHELWYIFCVAAAEPNFEEGLRWLQMAADKGYSVAQHDLASCYLNGTGVMVDTMAAVRLFRVAAEQGNADAQNSLGSCYHYGYGIPQDCGMALHWYRRAASQDNDAAICNLGRCYACGYGVVPNIIKAVQLYRKSAELGCGEALCRLAMLAEKGDGVPKDIVQAARLFQEGAAAHNGSETWDLDVFGDLAYLASTYTEITTWFRQKATEDDAGAQYCLALCYLHGHGVRQSKFSCIDICKCIKISFCCC